MSIFDTDVQKLKNKVLQEVASLAFTDALTPENVLAIPERIIPEGKPLLRCCIYKERAIIGQRVQLALGGGAPDKSVVEVLPIACDECPVEGILVTQACRGCIAHRCLNACPKGAISIVNRHAEIDKAKCVECGRCAQACSYSAIIKQTRPCISACKVRALSLDPDSRKARIDHEKCISCGACVYQCPFGAIMDKSFIVDVIDILKGSDFGKNYKVYAVVAPSIASQFTYAKLGQVITGLKKIGFHAVVEAALGADMVAMWESKEIAEKGFVTSSCCPGFVRYIQSAFPALEKYISHNPSPMAAIGQYIKRTDPTAKIVFIGPCTAKKMEMQREEVRPYIDSVLTFEELQALFDSREFDIQNLEEDVLDNASYYGRLFARSGGVTDAAVQALKEQNIDFEIKPEVCDGIEACKMALLKKSKNALAANFIEGMACEGGCIGGAGCLTHGPKDKTQVDKYGQEAFEKTITDALSVL